MQLLLTVKADLIRQRIRSVREPLGGDPIVFCFPDPLARETVHKGLSLWIRSLSEKCRLFRAVPSGRQVD